MERLTIIQAAYALGMSYAMARHRILRGEMQADRSNPRQWFVTRAEVERWQQIDWQHHRPATAAPSSDSTRSPDGGGSYTIREAAAILDLTHSAVQRLVQRGMIRATRPRPRKIRIPVEEVQRWQAGDYSPVRPRWTAESDTGAH